MNGSQILILVLSFVSAAAVAGLLYRAKQNLVKDREVAIDLSAKLQSVGLVYIPRILRMFATNNIAGMLHEMKATADIFLHHPDMVEKEFAVISDRILSKRLETKAGQDAVATLLAKAATPPVDVSVAPVVAVK